MAEKVASQIIDIKYTDWNKLFAFIPEIEATDSFGKWSSSDNTFNRLLSKPKYKPAPIISDFIRTIYAIELVIDFEWMNWRYGQDLLRDHTLDYNMLDVLTLCKLITLMVRREQISEGYLYRCFEDGSILYLLYSLKSKVEEELLT